MGEVHDPRAVANFIIDTRRFLGGNTTALELQKILYFCHGSYLVGTGSPLVAGSFEAWEHGPVHPLVYHTFKDFRDTPLKRRASVRNVVTGKAMLIARPDKPAQRHIIKVVSSLFDLGAGTLVDLSHARGGPWDLVWRKKDSKGAVISDRTIAEHYAKHRVPVRADEANNATVILRDIPPYDD